jgi:aspartyl-tRNA(Asn)/glutamyl-tRNA(Gln) amidotransferase subunit C
MIITDEMLKYIFELAKLELNPDKAGPLKKDLEEIIEYMKILKEADLEGIEPMSHAFSDTNAYRDDIAVASMNNEELLANAPESKDGYFVAPKAIE